ARARLNNSASLPVKTTPFSIILSPVVSVDALTKRIEVIVEVRRVVPTGAVPGVTLRPFKNFLVCFVHSRLLGTSDGKKTTRESQTLNRETFNEPLLRICTGRGCLLWPACPVSSS